MHKTKKSCYNYGGPQAKNLYSNGRCVTSLTSLDVGRCLRSVATFCVLYKNHPVYNQVCLCLVQLTSDLFVANRRQSGYLLHNSQNCVRWPTSMWKVKSIHNTQILLRQIANTPIPHFFHCQLFSYHWHPKGPVWHPLSLIPMK